MKVAPSRRGLVLWILLVLAAIGAIWYYFVGPGVDQPWPWEWLRQRVEGGNRR
jgi:hypothetical protein